MKASNYQAQAAATEAMRQEGAQATGTRRDREVGVLRRRVTDLEEALDRAMAEISTMRRHLLFHGPDKAMNPEFVHGCAYCERWPSDEERALAEEYSKEAKLAQERELIASAYAEAQR